MTPDTPISLDALIEALGWFDTDEMSLLDVLAHVEACRADRQAAG